MELPLGILESKLWHVCPDWVEDEKNVFMICQYFTGRPARIDMVCLPFLAHHSRLAALNTNKHSNWSTAQLWITTHVCEMSRKKQNLLSEELCSPIKFVFWNSTIASVSIKCGIRGKAEVYVAAFLAICKMIKYRSLGLISGSPTRCSAGVFVSFRKLRNSVTHVMLKVI